MKKKILVLMSTYNGEKFLKVQLESILSQENVYVDILIRDDCSKDRTVQIIEEFIQLNHNKIFLIQGPNLGYAKSFSVLLETAAKKYPGYDYYAFSDQDDFWLPQKLIQAVLKLEEQKNNNLQNQALGYCSNLTYVDSKLNVLKERLRDNIYSISDTSIIINPICTGCTMVFNLNAIQLYVNYKHSYIKYHDFLMGIICYYLGALVYDNESYIYYRQHGNNQIGARLNFRQRMINRIHFLIKGEKNVTEKICQDFLNTYKELLPQNKINNLKKIANYRKGINRIFLILLLKNSNCSHEKSFFLKCKILLGRL